MGILQAGYRTYEAQSHYVGLIEEGKVPLTPVAHSIQKASIEITINADGTFDSARKIKKDEMKTIIPVTMKSAVRVGGETVAHPLSEQIRFLTSFDGVKFDIYFTQLKKWADSEFSHEKVRAVLAYIGNGTILKDLQKGEVITLDETGNVGEGKIEGTDYDKCLVRFRVISPTSDTKSACWEDVTLFDSYINFYAKQCQSVEQGMCYISGKEDVICTTHPKGTSPINYGPKLISSNDSSNFTYKGRFIEPEQACVVGYISSQKAHSAIRWISANYGIIIGGRVFICWNPNGGEIPIKELFYDTYNNKSEIVDYKDSLAKTLLGYKQALKNENDDVVIAVLDAATEGRLSVTYYNELKASDFLERIEYWYNTFQVETSYGLITPTIRQIANCAFGVQQKEFIETDEKVLRENVQRLFHCIIDKQAMPADIVKAIAIRASTPLAYNNANRERVLMTACAVLRKYYIDKHHKEEWTVSLDKTNTNRSYLFGRLFAVLEKAERKTYKTGEDRDPNAIRMQSIFTQRPLYAWRILEEKLIPYFLQLTPGTRNFYKGIIEEIAEKLSDVNDTELGKKLDDVYLLGYYHQRAELAKKKEVTTSTEEENENE